MSRRPPSRLNPKKRYLQVALNNTLDEAKKIIARLPISDRIILEAGTPLIKRYGESAIRKIREWYDLRLLRENLSLPSSFINTASILSNWDLLAQLPSNVLPQNTANKKTRDLFLPYVVADLKTMDRGETEVKIAARAGASAAVALGHAPIETLNSFITACEENGIDAMIDMMNVEFPLSVLRALKKPPAVVILHRGVDEEQFNKEKQIPLHEIRRIKGNYDIMIAIAGGDTLREVQRSIFNDADIAVVWKSVFKSAEETVELINGFLKEIK